jgi:Tol biopolymer transport system component
MKKAVVGRVTARNGVIPSAYQYMMVDTATGKQIILGVPADLLVTRWSPDGKWLLGYQHSNFQYWLRYTLADGKLHSIVKNRVHQYLDVSPDSKTLIGYGHTREGVVGGPKPPNGMNQFDVATGALTTGDKWTQTPEDMLVISRWSLDGKRVAHAVRTKTAKGEESGRIVVCDPDGGNAVKLATIPSQFMGDISWLPSRRKAAAPRPK